MRNFFALLAHLLVAIVRLWRPGGLHAVAAESLAIKHQLQVMQRSRRRSPKLTPWDRLLFGLCAFLIPTKRLLKCAVIIKPATILRFHQRLVQHKYGWLYGSKTGKRPGPKGPSQALIHAVLEMKRRNPRFGYRKIAEQISPAFGIEIDKDVVRRILAKHYQPDNDGDGISWLTASALAKDSLWSIDLFRCESILLNSFWVMVVMDVFSRQIIGFGVHRGDVDGIAVCRLFNEARRGHSTPKRLSTDHDPLFRFHRWRTNLRILDTEEIKTVPFVPQSHPFVERLVGTLRREYLDRLLFWNGVDLMRKLLEFRDYYNAHRCHSGLGGATPTSFVMGEPAMRASLQRYRWVSHCHGLFQLPLAA